MFSLYVMGKRARVEGSTPTFAETSKSLVSVFFHSRIDGSNESLQPPIP